MRIVQHFLLCLLIASCTNKESRIDECEAFLPAQRLAELTDKKLQEVSGLASSFANPGHLWVHNDSGNPAAVYLVNEKLEIQLECQLHQIKNRDWEDMAVGPGPEPGKRYLYVADIGDNNAKHNLKYIYRFEEPVASPRNKKVTITRFDTIVFRLEDGKKDTEAIMVHPETKDIYLVSKREKPVYVYQLTSPFSKKDTLVAKRLLSIPLTQIVSAGFSHDGQEIVMKNYDDIYYWQVGKQSVRESLADPPVTLCYSEEPQGESIAFDRDGAGFYTLSERIKGEKTYLYFYPRKEP